MLLIPAMYADQVDKTDAGQDLPGDLVTISDEETKILDMLIANRHDQAAGIGQLRNERGRNFRPAGRDDDRIIGSVFRPAQGAIGKLGNNIVIPQAIEYFPGPTKQTVNPFEGIYLATKSGENSRLVTRTRTDLQHRLPPL